MLMRLCGSRTSESGEKFFPKFFLPLFTGVSENLFAFFPQKCSSILPKFLTTFFFFYFPKIFGDLFFFLVIDLFHGRIGPPWIRTSRGAEGGPLWTPRFS